MVGVETGVDVARGGQAVMPQLPSATVNTETAKVQAAPPANPLLQVGADALALLGLSIAGVFIVRRKKRK